MGLVNAVMPVYEAVQTVGRRTEGDS